MRLKLELLKGAIFDAITQGLCVFEKYNIDIGGRHDFSICFLLNLLQNALSQAVREGLNYTEMNGDFDKKSWFFSFARKSLLQRTPKKVWHHVEKTFTFSK